MEKINIAVDGFSSCGKSTIAKGLAKKLGYTYIDSGAMYRAVALFAYRNGWIDRDTLIVSAERYGKSPYGQHLRRVADGKIMY